MELLHAPTKSYPSALQPMALPDPENWAGWLKILRSIKGAMNTDNILRCIYLRLREYRADQAWPQCVIDEVSELGAELQRIRDNHWAAREKKKNAELLRKIKAEELAGRPRKLPRILELWQSRLPSRPYCTNNFESGVKIRSKDSALTHKEIQPNSPWEKQCLVIDVDHAKPLPPNVPPPNILVTNPITGHRHAIFLWKTPVLVGPNASRKAVNYYNDIAIALRIALEGDPNYRGTLCHNPLNPRWETEILSKKPYQLKAFRETLNRVKAGNLFTHSRNIQRNVHAACGRNCSTFEASRRIAYTLGPRPDLYDLVRTQVDSYNQEYNEPPLSSAECHQIAKSITRYVSSGRRQLLISKTHTPELQTSRGRASGAARRNRTADQRDRAIALYQGGKTQIEIARILAVHQSTICRWLKDCGKNMHEPIQDNSGDGGRERRRVVPLSRTKPERRLVQGGRVRAPGRSPKSGGPQGKSQNLKKSGGLKLFTDAQDCGGYPGPLPSPLTLFAGPAVANLEKIDHNANKANGQTGRRRQVMVITIGT